MPTPVANPIKPAAFYSPAPLLAHTTGTLQSPDSAQVQTLIDEIVKRWAEVEESRTTPDVNDIEYHAIRPRRVVKFKVRMRMLGRGRPLLHEIDDSEE